MSQLAGPPTRAKSQERTMSEKPLILDTPSQIQAFVMLQIYYKLKLEVEHPNGPTWHDSPRKQALMLMERSGVKVKQRNRKASVFAAYKLFLSDLGLLKNGS